MDGVDLAEVRKMGVYEEFVGVGKRVVRDLGLSEGEAGLIVNGRVSVYTCFSCKERSWC